MLQNLYSQYSYRGRGLVITAGSSNYKRALVTIRILRHRHHLKLPIQVWKIGREFGEDVQRQFEDLDVVVKDILVEQKRFAADFAQYQIKHDYGSARNYQIKTLVLLMCDFEEVMYLDSDNVPLQNPEFLFDVMEYRETGALFWPDFGKFSADHPMWAITNLTCEDEYEQESGQLVIDKKRSWSALLTSLYFQRNHAYYFTIILGDKDTFRFGWKLTHTPYHMVEHPAGLAGRTREDAFCGYVMVQFAPDGDVMFMHTTLLKNSYAVRGISWETIQYFERQELQPLVDVVPIKGVASFSVDVPKLRTHEGGRAFVPSREHPEDSPETAFNPCIRFEVDKNVRMDTTTAAWNSWGDRVVEHVRVMTHPFKFFQHGRFAWLEDAYYDFGGTSTVVGSWCSFLSSS